MPISGDNEECPRTAAMIQQSQGVAFRFQSRLDLSQACVNLGDGRSAAPYVMVDNQALPSSHERQQLVKESVFRSARLMRLDRNLKPVVRVRERQITLRRYVKSPLHPPASMCGAPLT
tara:strand:+ start:333 stop:686 length:354 start_codon:yes stop_codon:yes gene_type:complete